MEATSPYRVPRTEADLEVLAGILAEAFSHPRERLRQRFPVIGPENLRILERDDRVVGGLWLIPGGQFFGGRPVPMTGVAGVGIAPEHRGRGAARDLMAAAVREMHAAGTALSCLYPAAQTLYRSVGYEQAGHHWRHEMNLAGMGVRDTSLETRSLGETDLPAVEALYRTVSRPRPGHLDRGPYLWNRVLQPGGEPARGYGVWGRNGLEGYVFLVHRDKESGFYHLTATDIVFATPAAGRRLLTFLAHHSSMAGEVRWHGGPADPLALLLPEQRLRVSLRFYWMLRVCHVEAALAGRGYPRGVEVDLHLEIEDDVVPENAGRYRLQVRDGRGSVERGGRGELRMHVRALAALYSGFHGPHALQATGALAGPAEALERAAAAFAGPAPSMPDMF